MQYRLLVTSSRYALLQLIFNDLNMPFYPQVIDEDIRPPQLSLELAPKRAGHHWRVQALNASVWSALVLGTKRWGLYPPSQYFVPGRLNSVQR